MEFLYERHHGISTDNATIARKTNATKKNNEYGTVSLINYVSINRV